jgi:hypothetical protein
MATPTRVAFDKWWASDETAWARHARIPSEDAYGIYLRGWADALQGEIDALNASIEEDKNVPPSGRMDAARIPKADARGLEMWQAVCREPPWLSSRGQDAR